jgi:hypothetical protein
MDFQVVNYGSAMLPDTQVRRKTGLGSGECVCVHARTRRLIERSADDDESCDCEGRVTFARRGHTRPPCRYALLFAIIC